MKKTSWRRVFLIAISLLLPLIAAGDSRPSAPYRLVSEADHFAMLYNWPLAASRYAQAENLFIQAGDTKNALLARLGYFWATADVSVNPAVVEEVAKHLEDSFVQSDRNLLMRALVTKAVLDRNSNELAARAPWERILKLASVVGDHQWEGRAKAEIGQILYMDGDIKSAAEMLRDAIRSQYLRGDFGGALHYTSLVGNGFVEAGQPEAGLKYANIVLRLRSFVPDHGFPYLAYQGKARALLALNRTAEAEGVLTEAISRARADKDLMALAQLLVVSGTIENLTEATRISDDNGFRHVLAWSSIELAKAYRRGGDFDRAELWASKGIRLVRALEDRYHLPQDLSLLADLQVRNGKLDRANETYSEATDVLDALLVNVTRRQLKSSLIAALSEAYVGHFELVARKLFDPARAYEIIERARGRALADTLRGQSETLTNVDNLTVESQAEINRIQLALVHETNRSKRQDLLDSLFATEQLLSPVSRTTSALGPTTGRSTAVPLRVLRASLRPDEVVLEYVLSEPESYCLRITHENVQVVVLSAGRKRIEALVDNYLAAVRARQSDSSVSQELFSLILEPAITSTLKLRLVIVPDGKLNLLPFDALRDSHGDFVLESHVVTYAPSATVLYLLRQNPSPEQLPMSLVGVGGAVYSGNAAGKTLSENTAADFFDLDAVTFPKLPGSKQEVQAIGKILKGPTRLLLEENATETAFKALPLENFRIVHLAVHGIANSEFPDRAALVLGTSPASPDDGLLQVREIRDLPLRADLVVLSACETGSGRLLGEEGIASLERAFLLAGAKAVIASLWTADDIYTVALMKRFYQHLASGTDKASALRQAKRDLLKEFGDQALPVYWAGFTLVGDAATSSIKRPLIMTTK